MIGKRIKFFREKSGISQQKLAIKANLSIAAITHIEQGVAKQPSIQTIIKIADALNVSLDELVGRDYKPKKKK